MGSFEPDVGPQTKTITITRGDGGPLDLKVLGFHKPGPTAKLRVIEPGQRYELDVTFSRAGPNGRYSNSVELDTGVAEQPRDKVRFSAYFASDVRDIKGM